MSDIFYIPEYFFLWDSLIFSRVIWICAEKNSINPQSSMVHAYIPRPNFNSSKRECHGCLYKFINFEYASLGQSIWRIGEKSMRLSSDLNFDIFSSEKERMCLNCGVGFFWVDVEM